MYSNKEIAEAALLRAAAITAGRKRKRLRVKAAVKVFGFCALMTGVILTSPGMGPPDGKIVIDDEAPPLAAVDAGPGIVFSGAGGATIPANTAEVKILLGNPVENPGFLEFEIMLEDTGEVLYRSGRMAPGENIDTVTLSRPIEKGKHKAVLTAGEYAPGGLEELSRTSIAFDLTAE